MFLKSGRAVKSQVGLASTRRLTTSWRANSSTICTLWHSASDWAQQPPSNYLEAKALRVRKLQNDRRAGNQTCDAYDIELAVSTG